MRRPIFLGLALACAPPAPPPDVAPGLLEDLEELEGQADALAEEGAFLAAAARACVDPRTCIAGVEALTFEAGRLACRCRRPNVGVHPVRRAAVAQAAGRETLARPAGRPGGAP